MNNDLSPRGVSAYTERRRNKSIWLRSGMALAMVVVLLTTYMLIFPARTVEKELICGQAEHVHDESCWLTVLTCTLEEDDSHSHAESCYTRVLVCGLEEHVHTDECYAEPEPEPELTEAPGTEAPGTDAPVTEAPETGPVLTEPAAEDPADAEPAVTESGNSDPDGEEPAVTEPVQTDPAASDPFVTEEPITDFEPDPSETMPPAPVFFEEVPERGPGEARRIYIKPWEKVRTAAEEYTPSVVYPETGIDLANYLTSAIFQRQDGSALVEDTFFENGETAKATFIYDIPDGVVTPENRYVYYQIRDGIRPIEETSGDVMDEGRVVGTYTITEGGLIQILFNEDFANGNAIIGTVDFTSWLYANEDGTDRVVVFENDAGTITITVPDEQKYELKLSKNGAFSEDYTSVDYVLTLESERGTGAPVSLFDHLTNNNPATLLSAGYDHGSFEVWHVAEDGTRTRVTDVSIVWSTDDMSFATSLLPALEPGESYEIRYTVDMVPDLSGSFSLSNLATATAGTLETTASARLLYTCDVLKSGAFNPNTGLIDWEITVNPASRPVAGWRIYDTLPYPAVGSVLLYDATNAVFADITPNDGVSLYYQFPPNAPDSPFHIRYSTAAPASAGTVSNKVRLVNERETIVTSEVTVTERTEGVKKELSNQIYQPNGLVQTLWDFHVTLPMDEMETYTFRDNISTPILDQNTGDYLNNNLHYGYAAELEAAFRGNLRLVSDGTSWYYGDPENTYVNFHLTYFDSQGYQVAPDDTTTHVARVVFAVEPLAGSTFHGYEIVAEDYPTWLDASSAEVGANWSYQNLIYLRSNKFTTALAFYHKGNAFEKQVNLSGSGGKFNSLDGSTSYGACGGILEYRLLLDLTAMPEDSFTVTDVLPAGLELIQDGSTPRAFFSYATLSAGYNGTFVNEGSFTVTTEPGADGSTVVTFHGSGVTGAMKNEYAYVCIVYKARLTGEEWNDYSYYSETFTNHASWNEYSDDRTVTVERQPKRLAKDGVQLEDEEHNALNRLRFTLEINLGAEDLDPESDWIRLTDTLNSEIAANIELSSIRLYHYDPTKPNHIGNMLRFNEYQLSYNTATRTLTVDLQDEAAYVLVYDYTVDQNAILDGQTEIDNSATLAGIFHTSSEVVLKGVSSSASAWQQVVTVNKVDEENNSKVLPGAEFVLDYWDVEHQTWVRATDENGDDQIFVTNEAGQIVLSLLGNEKDLVIGTLYRLTETEPPPGYERPEDFLFFMCMPRFRDSMEEVFSEASVGSGVEYNEVTFFGPNGGVCVVTNSFSGLSVEKRWFAADGTEMVDPDREPITVTLYSSTDPSGEGELTPVPATETVQNPIQLGPEDGWTYTWGKLPAYDENDDQIYYFVVETPVPGYTVTYVNNGVTGGTITISNDSEPYELPETGSMGSRRLVELGGMLVLVSAIAYVVIKQKSKKQEATK